VRVLIVLLLLGGCSLDGDVWCVGRVPRPVPADRCERLTTSNGRLFDLQPTEVCCILEGHPLGSIVCCDSRYGVVYTDGVCRPG